MFNLHTILSLYIEFEFGLLVNEITKDPKINFFYFSFSQLWIKRNSKHTILSLYIEFEFGLLVNEITKDPKINFFYFSFSQLWIKRNSKNMSQNLFIHRSQVVKYHNNNEACNQLVNIFFGGEGGRESPHQPNICSFPPHRNIPHSRLPPPNFYYPSFTKSRSPPPPPLNNNFLVITQ